MAARKPNPKRIVGNWEAFDEIGRGGMGVAIKARNLQTNQIAVLKFLLPRETEKDPKNSLVNLKGLKMKKRCLKNLTANI